MGGNPGFGGGWCWAGGAGQKDGSLSLLFRFSSGEELEEDEEEELLAASASSFRISCSM